LETYIKKSIYSNYQSRIIVFLSWININLKVFIYNKKNPLKEIIKVNILYFLKIEYEFYLIVFKNKFIDSVLTIYFKRKIYIYNFIVSFTFYRVNKNAF